MRKPRFQLAGTLLSTRDAGALAGFYQRLLGLPKRYEEEGWVILRAHDSFQALSFHQDLEFTPPVHTSPQQMAPNLAPAHAASPALPSWVRRGSWRRAGSQADRPRHRYTSRMVLTSSYRHLLGHEDKTIRALET